MSHDRKLQKKSGVCAVHTLRFQQKQTRTKRQVDCSTTFGRGRRSCAVMKAPHRAIALGRARGQEDRQHPPRRARRQKEARLDSRGAQSPRRLAKRFKQRTSATLCFRALVRGPPLHGKCQQWHGYRWPGRRALRERIRLFDDISPARTPRLVCENSFYTASVTNPLQTDSLNSVPVVPMMSESVVPVTSAASQGCCRSVMDSAELCNSKSGFRLGIVNTVCLFCVAGSNW